MPTKFCPKCGNKLEPDVSFCKTCGADLSIRTESPDTISPGVSQPTQIPKIKQETVIYADLLKRTLALMFDSILIFLIGSVFSFFLINPWFPINIFDPFGAWWFTFPFDWLAGFLYHWLMETHNNGQTLGKMAIKIKTVDEKTFKQANSRNLAINNLFKSSPFLIIDFIIGRIKNYEDPKKRLRIMQNVSETVVIYARKIYH
jgi:uncharacterized RDD family membrane protein YckC